MRPWMMVGRLRRSEELLENAKKWAHELRDQLEVEHNLRIAAEEKLKFKENLTAELTEARERIKKLEAPQWEIEKERIKVAMQREARIRELAALLIEARDEGLIYWEPRTTRGHTSKAQLLAKMDRALAAAEKGVG